jgi:pimeloyl-ACP methyl ester carboxylesterase
VQAAHVATPRRELERLTVPTLVLSGRDDHVNGDPAKLEALLPNSGLCLIPGDHLGTITSPEFALELIGFLNETH